MNRTTAALLSLAAGLLLLTASCSSGGSSGGGTAAGVPSEETRVQGNLVSVDGQSDSLSGVEVMIPEASTVSTSDSDGYFDLGMVPARPLEVLIDVSATAEHGFRRLSTEVDFSGGGEVMLRLSVDDDRIVRLGVERSCGGDQERSEARAPLDALRGGLRGHVKVRREVGRQDFDVEAENLSPGEIVEIVVVNPDTDDTDSLGTIAADSRGEAEIEIRTHEGDRLPFGAADLDDLEGFLVEVIDTATGGGVLRGRVPFLGSLPTCATNSGDARVGNTDGGVETTNGVDTTGATGDTGVQTTRNRGDDGNSERVGGETRLTNASGVSGIAEANLRSRPARGEERIEVDVRNTNVGGGLELWLEDPLDPGVLMPFGNLRLRRDVLEFERDTENGERLPFGVSRAADLSGLDIEIRRADDGSVAYRGETPQLR